MSDLISRSALIEDVEDVFCDDCTKCMGSCRFGEIREIILNQPQVEICADCSRRKFYMRGYEAGKSNAERKKVE